MDKKVTIKEIIIRVIILMIGPVAGVFMPISQKMVNTTLKLTKVYE